MTDRELDDLLGVVRSDLAAVPSPGFRRRVWNATGPRRSVSRLVQVAAVGATCVLLAALWATPSRLEPQVLPLVVSVTPDAVPATPIELAQPTAPAGLTTRLRPVRQAADALVGTGTGLALSSPESGTGSVPSFTPATFQPVVRPEVPIWLVEPNPPAVTMAEPGPAPFEPVEFPPVEFTTVELPPSTAVSGLPVLASPNSRERQ